MNETAEDLRLEVARIGDYLQEIAGELKELNEKLRDYFTIQISEEVEQGKR